MAVSVQDYYDTLNLPNPEQIMSEAATGGTTQESRMKEFEKRWGVSTAPTPITTPGATAEEPTKLAKELPEEVYKVSMTATRPTQEGGIGGLGALARGAGRGVTGAIAEEVDTIDWLANKVADAIPGFPRQEVIGKIRDYIKPEDLDKDEETVLGTIGEALGWGVTQVALLYALFMKPLRAAKIINAAKVRQIPQLVTKAGRAAIMAERPLAAGVAGPVKEVAKATTVAGKVAQRLGNVGLVGPLGLGIAGGISGAKYGERAAEEEGESKLKGVAAGGAAGFAQGFAMGETFGLMDRLPKFIRIPSFGTLFGGLSYLEGADYKRTLGDFVTGAVLGAWGSEKFAKGAAAKETAKVGKVGDTSGRIDVKAKADQIEAVLRKLGRAKDDPVIVQEAKNRGVSVEDYLASMGDIPTEAKGFGFFDDVAGFMITDPEYVYSTYQNRIKRHMKDFERHPEGAELAKNKAALEIYDDLISSAKSLAESTGGRYDPTLDPDVMGMLNNVAWEVTKEGASYDKQGRWVPGTGKGRVGQAYIVPSTEFDGLHEVPFLPSFMRVNLKVQNTMKLMAKDETGKIIPLADKFENRLVETPDGWVFKTATGEGLPAENVVSITDAEGNEIVGRKPPRAADVAKKQATIEQAITFLKKSKGEEIPVGKGKLGKPIPARIPMAEREAEGPVEAWPAKPVLKGNMVERINALWPGEIKTAAEKLQVSESRVKAEILKLEKEAQKIAKEKVGVEEKVAKPAKEIKVKEVKEKEITPQEKAVKEYAKNIVQMERDAEGPVEAWPRLAPITEYEKLTGRIELANRKEAARLAHEQLEVIPPENYLVKALEEKGFTTVQAQELARYDNLVSMLLDTHKLKNKDVTFTAADLQVTRDGRLVYTSPEMALYIDRLLGRLKKNVAELSWPDPEDIGAYKEGFADVMEQVEGLKKLKLTGKKAEKQQAITDYWTVVDLADALSLDATNPRYQRMPNDRMSIVPLSKRERELFNIARFFSPQVLGTNTIFGENRNIVKTKIQDYLETYNKVQTKRNRLELTPSQVDKAAEIIEMQNEARQISPYTGEEKPRIGRPKREVITERDYEERFANVPYVEQAKALETYGDMLKESIREPITSPKELDKLKQLGKKVLDVEQKLRQYGAKMANLQERTRLVREIEKIDTKVKATEANTSLTPEQRALKVKELDEKRVDLLDKQLKPLRAEIVLEPTTYVEPYESTARGARELTPGQVEAIKEGLAPGEGVLEYTGRPIGTPAFRGKTIATWPEVKLGEVIPEAKARAEEVQFKPLTLTDAKRLSDLVKYADSLYRRIDQTRLEQRIEKLQPGQKVEIGSFEVGIGTTPAVGELEWAAQKTWAQRVSKVLYTGPEGTTRGMEPLPTITGFAHPRMSIEEYTNTITKLNDAIGRISQNRKYTQETKEKRIQKLENAKAALKAELVPLTSEPAVGEYTMRMAARGRLVGKERERPLTPEEKARALEEDVQAAIDLSKISDAEMVDTDLLRQEQILRQLESEGMSREEAILTETVAGGDLQDPSLAAMRASSKELARSALGPTEETLLQELKAKGAITDPEKRAKLDSLLKEIEERKISEAAEARDLEDYYPDGSPTRARVAGTQKELYTRGTVSIEPLTDTLRSGREVAVPGKFEVKVYQDTMTERAKADAKKSIANIAYALRHNKAPEYTQRMWLFKEEAEKQYPWLLSEKSPVKESRRKTTLNVPTAREGRISVADLEYSTREYEPGYMISKRDIDKYDLQRLARLVKAADTSVAKGIRSVAMDGTLFSNEISRGPGKGKEVVWDFEWRSGPFEAGDRRNILMANAAERMVREYVKERGPAFGEGEYYSFAEHEGNPKFRRPLPLTPEEATLTDALAEYKRFTNKDWEYGVHLKGRVYPPTKLVKEEGFYTFKGKDRAHEATLYKRVLKSVQSLPPAALERHGFIAGKFLESEAKGRFYSPGTAIEPLPMESVGGLIKGPAVSPQEAKLNKQIYKLNSRIGDIEGQLTTLDISTPEGKVTKAKLSKQINILERQQRNREQEVKQLQKKGLPVREAKPSLVVGAVGELGREFDQRLNKILDKRLELDKMSPDLRESILRLQRDMEAGLREEGEILLPRPPVPGEPGRGMVEIGEELKPVTVPTALTREERIIRKGGEAPITERRMEKYGLIAPRGVSARVETDRLQAASNLLQDKKLAIRFLDNAVRTFNDLSNKIKNAEDASLIAKSGPQLLEANLDVRAIMEKIQGRNYPEPKFEIIDGIKTPQWIKDAAKVVRSYEDEITKFRNTVNNSNRTLAADGRVSGPETLIPEGAGVAGEPGEYRFYKKLTPEERFKRTEAIRQKEIENFEKKLQKEQEKFGVHKEKEVERKERKKARKSIREEIKQKDIEAAKAYAETVEPLLKTIQTETARQRNAEASFALSPSLSKSIRGLTEANLDAGARDLVKYQSSSAYVDADTLRRMAEGEPVKLATQIVPISEAFSQAPFSSVPAIATIAKTNIMERVRYAADLKRLIHDQDSHLRRIVTLLDEAGVPELKEGGFAEYFMRDLTPTNPKIIEALRLHKELTDSIATQSRMKELGIYVDSKNGFLPLIIDINKTYHKMRERWNAYKTPEDLPAQYHIGEKEFYNIKEVFNRKEYFAQSRKNPVDGKLVCDRYEQKVIEYGVFNWESVGLQTWENLPKSVKDGLKVKKDTWNPHLQARQPDVDYTAYKHNYETIMKQYIYDMSKANYMNNVKRVAAPLRNQYTDVGPLSIKRYIDRYLDRAFGRYDDSERFLANTAELMNQKMGREIITPAFAAKGAPGFITGQVAKGALGLDSAIRNSCDGLKSLVEDPHWGLGWLKAVKEYMTNYVKDPKSRGLGEYRQYEELLGLDRETFAMEAERGGPLKERLAKAEKLPKKALEFYEWLGDTLLWPFSFVEQFNKGTRFLMAINRAKELGKDWNEAVTLGFRSVSSELPELRIPQIIMDAHWATMQSHIGYSQPYRSPYLQGALGRLSTIFWSYPGDFIRWEKQGLKEGWKEGTKNQEWGKFIRFAGMLGFQASAAAAIGSLGFDVSSIWGYGMLPIKLMSLPWEILYNTYKVADPLRAVGIDNYTPEDRQKALDGLMNGLGMMFVPQFRFGKKVVRNFKSLEEGYKTTLSDGTPIAEVSPITAILDTVGVPRIGPKETWDLMAQMGRDRYEYTQKKRALKDEALEAYEKNNFNKIDTLMRKAVEQGVDLSYSDVYKAKTEKDTLTILQKRLKTMPKALRPQYEQAIAQIQGKTFPSGAPSPISPKKGSRGLWSSAQNIWGTEEEE